MQTHKHALDSYESTMGKFIRKAKLTSDAPTLGVHTRSRTLTLAAAATSEPEYLQLRSRRLPKPQLLLETKKKRSNCCSGEETVTINQQFRESNLGSQPIESAVREGNPHSNLISDVGNISTPRFSTRYPSSPAENQRAQSTILTGIPSKCELDDLFAYFEQQQQHFFMEKYNFDIINDIPLPGRFEWVKVDL